VIWDKQFGILKETLVAPVHDCISCLVKRLWSDIGCPARTVVLILAMIFGFRPDLSLLPLTYLS